MAGSAKGRVIGLIGGLENGFLGFVTVYISWNFGPIFADDSFSVGQTDKDEDEVGSFFDLFSPPTVRPGMDEEQKEEVQFMLEMDFDIAEQFKDELIPRAVDWYTGDAVSDDDDEDEDEEEEEEEEESDDDDDEEEEDEDRRPQQHHQKQAPRSYR